MRKLKNGFTLIELLVSISIIIVLSSVAIVSYQSANRRARDDRRKADLEKIRAALEMYRLDESEYPPDYLVLDDDPDPYLNEIPDDPKTGYDYHYDQLTDYTYELCASFEASDLGECGGGNCGTADCNYQLENP